MQNALPIKNTGLLCLLLAALPLCAVARSKHESEAKREFKLENRCPSTGANSGVIGGGSAGLVTAYIAAALKAKVTLVEKHRPQALLAWVERFHAWWRG